MKMVMMFVIQAIIVLAVAVFSFRLYKYDLTVPFQYGGDSIVILMYIKGLLQDGWPTVISHLSAPFFYSGAAFPMLTSVDWLIMKCISLFTSEPGLILNQFWLMTLILSAITASYSSYQVGLNKYLASIVGILYAFLPFALERNVSHLNLVYYLVPLICLLSIVIFTRGDYIRNTKQAKIVGLFACLLQGFNYVYYSFFAVLIFFVAAIFGWKKSDGFRQLRLAMFAIFLVSIATLINLTPYFISVYKDGPPPEMNYKSTLEAEVYGAKIRKMISPHPDNAIKPLAYYAKNDLQANFPNENENVTARLGMFGAFGLLLAMWSVLSRRGSETLVFTLSSLSVATVFVITVGGLGAVINVLTVPDIRAYNRFSVFLSFFSMTTLGLWIQNQINFISIHKKALIWLILFLFALISLYDQLLDGQGLLSRQQTDTKSAHDERMVVEALELSLPNGAAVLQLPLTDFPLNLKRHNMDSYDHARAYLWSHHLSWSWPSFSIRHRAWQSRISETRGIEFVHAAILSGFQAIWIDRAAYVDQGAKLISDLNQKRVTIIPLPTSQYVVLDLRAEAAALRSTMTIKEFNQQAFETLGPDILLGWDKGFYAEEKSIDGFSFRWSQNKSQLNIFNFSDHNSDVCLKFMVVSPSPGKLNISIDDANFGFSLESKGKLITIPISIPANNSKRMIFNMDGARLIVNDDFRNMYFFVKNYQLDVIADTSECSNSMRDKS